MTDRPTANYLDSAKRVVIKIGSSLLVDDATGTLHHAWLEALAQDIAALRALHKDVIIVSSGAIALGRRHLELGDRVLKLEENQAAAAAGQIRLAHAFQETLGKQDLHVAQLLLTSADTEARRRYLNARNTINALLKLGAVPVINENDTVATDEIRVGDNDRLAARMAEMASADCLVLLSDVNGLYDANPRIDGSAKLIREVTEITPEIENMAGSTGSAHAKGGMVTKIAAAHIAVHAGCHMVITDGTKLHPLKALENGADCTWFVSKATPRSARKRWILGSLKPVGKLILDAGALTALTNGKSLLPAGVHDVEGDFERGDTVMLCGPDGSDLGRGLCAYSSKDARRIMGHKSGEIEELLGYRGRDEVVHRDDLALNDQTVS
ncbi:MAG: glutamate 5-kinase [Alphaproteobacteria bacterium]|jgi:glutamate 5-kinase|nr:glutamate 5-kinase [Alphaproteobacteria bacterium]MBT4966411.1 glutamate 5-kinase [Alphaproteobacteria bacterium]MBT5919695.1 glutamate 5-kinase [Alphaproteobacteria bacterium]MBT6474676.1 glutamate 5-kinase [Rhodospirillaceae bacterium]